MKRSSAPASFGRVLSGASSILCAVTKLVNLGSSCIYPRLVEQPMSEDALLTGPLEKSNEPYAIAKIAALKLSCYYYQQYGSAFISAIATNLYGPGDNFDLQTSHVLPALIRKFHEAKQHGGPVVLWGDGSPRREFLYSDDLADALVFLWRHFGPEEIGEFVNVGMGVDISIKELAELVAEIVGYDGQVRWDTIKPNGTPRKLLDVSRMSALGWQAKTPLREGIAKTYEWFLRRVDAGTQE